MIATTTNLSFTEFLHQVPEDKGRFELINGEIVQLEATRAHKNVARFLVKTFDRESERLKLNYIVDKDIVIRTTTATNQEQGRNPDVSVVQASVWNANVRAYGALTGPIQLAVEIASTNWDDDYIDKLDEYERLGILEYWIVDYLAIASRHYLGNPKQPTIFIYHLVGNKYQAKRYRGSEVIVSPTFPELKLTVAQIIAASGLESL
ncbi:MAG: Uma2 family endonuclease [Jaaginema sp. PMC 1079.18]|nr:Uma2 family endonuclease [Jaaginema sp. PMC 1080.18]MEC4849815.1 Uma2 family endonuclease [Jaaginema sp. PMC 1079.18]MEC4865259.1 Uma2 family endonuclease [Jaaginema sp. PMC 1078.18]